MASVGRRMQPGHRPAKTSIKGGRSMACCERTEHCAFYCDALATMPMISVIYKDYYCRGDNSDCAIRMLAAAIGDQQLPPDLFPNQTVRARKLIARTLSPVISPVVH
jgi:hypothetical protein